MNDLKRASRIALRVVFTALVLVAVVVGGQVPFGRESASANLRFALRTVEGRVEVCRDRSDAELQRVPVHMRQARICERLSPDFRLQVQLDDEQLLDVVVERRGVRADRPMSFDRSVEVPAGSHSIRASFMPVFDEQLGGENGLIESAKERSEVIRFNYEGTIELVANRITVLALDEENHTFEVVN